MNYETIMYWIKEVGEVIVSIGAIYGVIYALFKIVSKFSKCVKHKVIIFFRCICARIKRWVPFVWKKDYIVLCDLLGITQNQNIKLQSDIGCLQNEFDVISEKLKNYEKIEIIENIMYLGGREICSRCYDASSSNDRLRVTLLPSSPEIDGLFYCPACKTHYKTPEAALKQINKSRESLRNVGFHVQGVSSRKRL